ncbi:MAG TPA: hypothetical protein VHJ76_04100 [Actinomycetota bacterium]|nr:hypothetical protein [Actinomycetota bacterium]
MTDVEQLVRSGRLERVEHDSTVAATKLDEAERHLRSARAIAADDPTGAYVLLYDAARKAVDGHLAANGYRVSKTRLGAHEATALYARAVIGGEHAADAHALDRMRRNRNRVEYGSWHISPARLDADFIHAERLVAAVRAELGL